MQLAGDAKPVALTLAEPAGMVSDLAGPQELEMRDLIRTYLQASGKSRLTFPVRLPGAAGRAYRADENLNPGPIAAGVPGRRSWPRNFPADADEFRGRPSSEPMTPKTAART